MVIFDIETAPIADAALYLEPASAPSNYKDQAKIDAYIAEANKAALSRAALDVDLCRVVCIGLWFDGISSAVVKTAPAEQDERELIGAFWRQFGMMRLVGFNVLEFDLPVLLRRSLYLGIDAPKLEIGKYKHPRVDDLMQMLSFDGKLKYRGLDFYAKRFGIPGDGASIPAADIGAAVERGDWLAVELHCRNDVERTVALARRLGVVCTEEMVA